MSTVAVIKSKFAEYYRENARSIRPPPSLDRREFGFILFKQGVMVRHKGFRDEEEMRRFIGEVIPSDAYYSAAYYERPEEGMDKKGWLGATLFFDIDADHLETPCKTEHNYWICEDCNSTGKGQRPERCHGCGSTKLKEEAWLCEKCLGAAKAETLKLLDFLTTDFGLKEGDIDICFSGNRGYHVHVEAEDARRLNQAARREIVDYVLGVGLTPKAIRLKEIIKQREHRDILKMLGWHGRLIRGVYEFASSKLSKAFEEEGREEDVWKVISGLKGRTLEEAFRYAIQRNAANIDTVVTTDIHRLMRLPSTLHGKTGFKVVNVPVERFGNFDPLAEAIAFEEGMMAVYVRDAYSFRVGDETYGPYHDERMELPTAASMFLLCKKVAEPAR